MNLDEYAQLKKRVTKTRREADKAQGALDSLMVRLKKEFGCSTIEEAEHLLVKLQREKDQAEKEFERAVSRFQKKWKEELDGS